MAIFFDAATKIGIGSCYGGATFEFPEIENLAARKMNGDSLMMALGKLFPQAKIYGSESWVMTKPGLFNNKRAAVAGFPKRKLFRDVCYRPAWENMGKWNEYNAAKNTFSPVNPVTLDSFGNLQVTAWSFSEKPDTQKGIRKNLSKLGYDLYK